MISHIKLLNVTGAEGPVAPAGKPTSSNPSATKWERSCRHLNRRASVDFCPADAGLFLGFYRWVRQLGTGNARVEISNRVEELVAT